MQATGHQVLPGISMISLPIPFNVDPVNVYFLNGKVPTLIDTGIDSKKSLSWLEEELAKAGSSVQQIKQVLLTHGHIDHSGLAGRIHQVTGAPIRIHPFEWEKMKKLQYPSQQELEQQFKLYKSWGVGRDTVEKFDEFRQQMNRLGALPPKAMQLIQEGEEIEAGDCLLTPVATPGHSPGHICYYLQARKALFCGDHLLARISPNPCLLIDPEGSVSSGLPLYLESLQKLTSYQIEMCLAGHGKPITDMYGRIASLQADHAQRQLKFKEYLLQAGPTDLYRLTLHFLKDLGRNSDQDLFLAMREVFGQVSLLERKGQVKKETVNGIWSFSLL